MTKRNVNVDRIEYSIRDTSLGNLVLVARNAQLITLDITKQTEYEIKKGLQARYAEASESDKPFRVICLLLDRYLKGEQVDFNVDVDISQEGKFTQRVLEELRKIPYGQTRSYGWLAKKLGYTNAARAVGQALGRNPIPIVIPCHRVIREDGSIGGFSMGIQIKERLLALEGVNVKNHH
ncbi:MAG: methylated-DNA--[protein]-cysteine S-methyltransferase [Syntrophus sp. (in: bacteria)]|nr:methylated-DNA--[protein]-cysteine S-methyltransferase [Syntrophus sp. (in: bacteria)]